MDVKIDEPDVASPTTPDAGDIDAATLDERAAPAALVGEAGSFHVVVTDKAWQTLQRHACTRLDAEVGGVLLGGVHRDADGHAYLLIDAGVAALAAESRASNVTFTAEAWTRIHEAIDRDHHGATIVGWYHTHPNFGIFLSEMDVFIQRHFFDAPHHVALVIDPVARTHGTFVWRAGTPTLQPTLIAERPIPAPTMPVMRQTPPARPPWRRRRPFFASAVGNRIDSVARFDVAQWAALAALLLLAAALLGMLGLLVYQRVRDGRFPSLTAMVQS